MPCVLYQALTFGRATSDDDFSVRKLVGNVLRTLQDTNWSQSPAELIERVLEESRETLNAADPMAPARAQAREVLSGFVPALRERLARAEDPLAFAVTAAAAANLADEMIFPAFQTEEQLQKELERCLAKGFAKGAPSDLAAALEGAERVLYLLDNAGEAHVDALLIEQLAQRGLAVTVAVRGTGLLHDATRADAAAAGLEPTPPAPLPSPAAAPPVAEPPAAGPAATGAAPEADATTTAAEPRSSSDASTSDAAAPAEPTTASDASAGDAAPADASPEAQPAEPAKPVSPVVALLELKPGLLAWPSVSRASEVGVALDAADVVIAKGSAYFETFEDETREVIHLLRAKCRPVAWALEVAPGDLVLLRRSPPPPPEPEPEPPAE